MATQKRSGRKVRQQTSEQPPVREVLYDRVTGTSQEAIIRQPAPLPSRLMLRLRADQREHLDQVARTIEGTTGQKVSVSAIIRGALDAIVDADLDLGECGNEEDIRAAVSARLVSRS